jgi:hypothetical protein
MSEGCERGGMSEGYERGDQRAEGWGVGKQRQEQKFYVSDNGHQIYWNGNELVINVHPNHNWCPLLIRYCHTYTGTSARGNQPLPL